MALHEFSSSVISGVEEFKSLFSSSGTDRLVLCYEGGRDGEVTAAGLMALDAAVCAAAERHGAKVQLHFWECGSEAFAAARQQLGKEPGTPLLLIVYRQEIADMLQESLSAMIHNTERVCERLASYQRGGDKIAVLSPPLQHADAELRLSVDVSRLVGIGKRLMAQGKHEYAAKFFKRALDTLDAVAPQCDGDHNVDGSIALCLAWLALAEMVRGESPDRYMQRLQSFYAAFCDELGSDAARVRAAYRMFSALPLTWRSDTCSQKKLQEVLSVDPYSHDHRCALVVTFFLAGDIERCLTEAVKLSALQVPFGATAISAVADFMGRDHALIRSVTGKVA